MDLEKRNTYVEGLILLSLHRLGGEAEDSKLFNKCREIEKELKSIDAVIDAMHKEGMDMKFVHAWMNTSIITSQGDDHWMPKA